MRVKKNQAVNLGTVKTGRLQVLETGVTADSPVLKKEDQDLLPSLIRGPAQTRYLSALLMGDTITGNAGERLGVATSVGIRDTVFGTARRGRTPVGLDPS